MWNSKTFTAVQFSPTQNWISWMARFGIGMWHALMESSNSESRGRRFASHSMWCIQCDSLEVHASDIALMFILMFIIPMVSLLSDSLGDVHHSDVYHSDGRLLGHSGTRSPSGDLRNSCVVSFWILALSLRTLQSLTNCKFQSLKKRAFTAYEFIFMTLWTWRERFSHGRLYLVNTIY